LLHVLEAAFGKRLDGLFAGLDAAAVGIDDLIDVQANVACRHFGLGPGGPGEKRGAGEGEDSGAGELHCGSGYCWSRRSSRPIVAGVRPSPGRKWPGDGEPMLNPAQSRRCDAHHTGVPQS
jgi:hypothetical protein